MYKISVIIPAYNAEKYIGECLDSLVAQTMKDIQIVVIDDGSKDKTSTITEAYKSKYANIVVVHQENQGLFAARTVGMSIAEGEYIGWVDADDFVEPDMFEKLYCAAKTNDAEIAMCDYDFYPAKVGTKEKWFKPYDGNKNWKFIERNTQMWNKIVKKSLLEKVNFQYWMERTSDGIYSVVMVQAKEIVSINDQLYHYRVGHVSMSSNRKDYKKYEENILITQTQKDALGENKEWAEYFDYRIIYAILQCLIVAAHNEKRDIYRNCCRQLKQMQYRRNPLTKEILDYNHGKLKSFVLRNLVPANYGLANLIARFKF